MFLLLLHQVLVRGDIFLNCSLTEAFCIAIVEVLSAFWKTQNVKFLAGCKLWFTSRVDESRWYP